MKKLENKKAIDLVNVRLMAFVENSDHIGFVKYLNYLERTYGYDQLVAAGILEDEWFD